MSWNVHETTHGQRKTWVTREYDERPQTCASDNGNRTRSSGYVLAIGHRTAVWLGGAPEARVPIAGRLGSLNPATVFRSPFTIPLLSPDEPGVPESTSLRLWLFFRELVCSRFWHFCGRFCSRSRSRTWRATIRFQFILIISYGLHSYMIRIFYT